MRAVSIVIVLLLLLPIGPRAYGVDLDALDSEDCWGLILEMNEFPEGWTDLPVDYIDSERIRTALITLGWRGDHLRLVNGNLTIVVVQEAVEWLVNNTDTDDIALLYVFTHGRWMRDVLLWNTWFPDEWERLNTPKRILLIDSCSAEEFFEPFKDDLLSHISLGCCAANEISWAGLEEEGLPIIGSVWNCYFTNALCNSSADFDENGVVSIEEAFNFSAPLVQRYMNDTVFAIPEFLESYHNAGVYPEHYDAYPHPVLDDNYPDQLVIPEFTSLIVLTLMAVAIPVALIFSRKSRIQVRTERMPHKSLG